MQLQTIHGPAFSAQAYIYDSDPVDYTYTAYIVYDIPGCEMIPVASNTIHVKRNPIVTIEGNHNYCYFGPSYDNVILTAWVDGDLDPDATYKWYKNGEYRSNTNGYDNHYLETWEPSYDNPYIFTVEVTNGDGCTTISDPFEVNVYARPYTNITADADSICEGGYVTMRANLDNYNDPMLTYQWYKNDILQEGQTGQYYHEGGAILNGYFYAIITDTKGHTYRTCDIVLPAETGSNPAPQRTHVYPIPVSGGEPLTIEGFGGTAQIISLAGERVATVKLNETTTVIEAPRLSGIYFVQIFTEDGGFDIHKLIVK
jgi:hypothetical protein